MDKTQIDIKFFIIEIILLVIICVSIAVGTNSCSDSDWNNGTCPICKERYELRGASNGFKYYSCPNCGKEVKRY